MKSYTLIVLSIAYLLISSCSTKEVLPSKSIADYTNLETGNYWVYQWYEIEPDGSESPFNRRDSVYIKSDTIINGRKHYIKSSAYLKKEITEILFDSANSLYSYPNRELLFTIDSTTKTTIIFGPQNNPITTGTYSLKNVLISVNVPAGDFDCLNFEGVIESLENDYPHGTRLNSNFYSKSVGLVKMTTNFYNSPNNLEKRLVKFGKN